MTSSLFAKHLEAASTSTARWRPIAEAPEDRTLLVRNGASLCFACKVFGQWKRSDGRTFEPEEYMEPVT